LAELTDDALLNHFAARAIDRMSDVGIELGAAVFVQRSAIGIETVTTIIAVVRAKMVLCPALWTVGSELAAGHGDERAAGAFDDFQVADDKTIVKRDRAERLQSLAGLFHQFDANFGDFHGRSPCVADTRPFPAGR